MLTYRTMESIHAVRYFLLNEYLFFDPFPLLGVTGVVGKEGFREIAQVFFIIFFSLGLCSPPPSSSGCGGRVVFLFLDGLSQPRLLLVHLLEEDLADVGRRQRPFWIYTILEDVPFVLT